MLERSDVAAVVLAPSLLGESPGLKGEAGPDAIVDVCCLG